MKRHPSLNVASTWLSAMLTAVALFAASPSARAVITFNASAIVFPATEGQAQTFTVTTFTHSDTSLTMANFTASINWGDGTASTTGTISGGSGSFFVSGLHTYSEEFLPPGQAPVVVTVQDVANSLIRTANSTALVADAALFPGHPIDPGSPATFTGVGGTVTSGGAHNALASFETAIGGVLNTPPAPQSGGFRTINWDGVALDGTDFGGNTVVIVANKVVGIPINRFQTRGVQFAEVYSVAGDGFVSVNANAAGLFPSFSPSNVFAMFNENSIGLDFILPAAANVPPTPAAVRAFGCIFRNVRLSNSTAIEYFHGAQSLGKFFAPSSAVAGDAEFLGVVFSQAIVTRVEITMGTEVLFNFDGVTHSAASKDNPNAGHNLVVTDDFAYAEPVPLGASTDQPLVTAAAGTSTGTIPVAIFADADPSGVAGDYTATIDWGDGQTSAGAIGPDATGGFDVLAAHTYLTGGVYPIQVQIEEFGGSALSVANTAVVTGTPKGILVVGADAGSAPRVQVYDSAGGGLLFDFLAFDPTFKGGVRVAAGDVNGDGIPDIIAAAGPGGSPLVKVFDGKTGAPLPAPLGSFMAYGAKFRGGVSVACGDFNHDGKADIVTAPGSGLAVGTDVQSPPIKGAAPQLKVFSGADGAVLLHFFGESAAFTKGLSVAAADVDGDGTPDIITGVGPGSPPFVNVFNGLSGAPLPLPDAPQGTFPAFDAKFKGGVFVAAGDLNGDGKAEIVVGPGPGGGPVVKVFDPTLSVSAPMSVTAFPPAYKSGLRVAVGLANEANQLDVFTGTGKGVGSQVRVFDGRTHQGVEFLDVSSFKLPGGINVAGSGAH